jgi:signal peptidase II
MTVNKKQLCILIAIGIAILFFDQFLKWLALDFFRGGFFNWKILSFGLYKNEGIAFGIRIPQILFYILVAVVLFFIIEKFKKDIKKGNWLVLLSLMLIGSGALSNILDRFFRGYVIDYIHFFSRSAINLADLAIIAGIIVLAWRELKSTKAQKHKNKKTV